MGRSIAQDGKAIYNVSPAFDPSIEARKYGVFAKHSLEKATARETDCFTTVSDITAEEARIILGRYPDKITLNGLDTEHEPWGYTPLESITYSTPTITTDLSGFGCWMSNLKQDCDDAVFVLKRKNCNDQKVITCLKDYLLTIVEHGHDNARAKALQIASFVDWKLFYQNYLDAYVLATKS